MFIFLSILPLCLFTKSKVNHIWLTLIAIAFIPFLVLDAISKWLIFLVLALLPILILKSEEIISQYGCILLCWISIIIFSVTDALLFYVVYEFLLVPMFYLIGYFGGRNAKLQAIYEFFIYTLIGSFALLIAFILIFLEFGTTDYTVFYAEIAPTKQYILFILIFLGFAVKVPFIPVHLWLPKAHVEAPTIISIFLAAILLKMGTYGYIRFLLPSCSIAIEGLRSLIITISCIGVLFTAILCFTAAMDIKKIIAYSSISHMNLAILAMFSNTNIGLEISVYFMISHGILSSGLFLLIGILYDRYHTRIISYYKGLVLLLPLYSIFFLLFTLGNIAFPLTSGFLSEIITFISLIITNPYIGILASFAIILTPVYALYILHLILYGNWSSHLIPTSDLSKLEFHLLLPLLFSTIFIGIYPNIILSSLSSACYSILFWWEEL